MPVVIALALALVALAVAIGSWFRPTMTVTSAPTTPQYSEQEVADAKKAMCEAYDKVLKVVQSAGANTSNDPTQTFPIAVNTRLAFHASGDYLLEQLNSYPATSAELAQDFRQLASSSLDISLAQIAHAPQEEIDDIKTRIDSADSAVKAACT